MVSLYQLSIYSVLASLLEQTAHPGLFMYHNDRLACPHFWNSWWSFHCICFMLSIKMIAITIIIFKILLIENINACNSKSLFAWMDHFHTGTAICYHIFNRLYQFHYTWDWTGLVSTLCIAPKSTNIMVDELRCHFFSTPKEKRRKGLNVEVAPAAYDLLSSGRGRIR